jgi:hypothetical protein
MKLIIAILSILAARIEGGAIHRHRDLEENIPTIIIGENESDKTCDDATSLLNAELRGRQDYISLQQKIQEAGFNDVQTNTYYVVTDQAQFDLYGEICRDVGGQMVSVDVTYDASLICPSNPINIVDYPECLSDSCEDGSQTAVNNIIFDNEDDIILECSPEFQVTFIENPVENKIDSDDASGNNDDMIISTDDIEANDYYSTAVPTTNPTTMPTTDDIPVLPVNTDDYYTTTVTTTDDVDVLPENTDDYYTTTVTTTDDVDVLPENTDDYYTTTVTTTDESSSFLPTSTKTTKTSKNNGGTYVGTKTAKGTKVAKSGAVNNQPGGESMNPLQCVADMIMIHGNEIGYNPIESRGPMTLYNDIRECDYTQEVPTCKYNDNVSGLTTFTNTCEANDARVVVTDWMFADGCTEADNYGGYDWVGVHDCISNSCSDGAAMELFHLMYFNPMNVDCNVNVSISSMTNGYGSTKASNGGKQMKKKVVKKVKKVKNH